MDPRGREPSVTALRTRKKGPRGGGPACRSSRRRDALHLMSMSSATRGRTRESGHSTQDQQRAGDQPQRAWLGNAVANLAWRAGIDDGGGDENAILGLVREGANIGHRNTRAGPVHVEDLVGKLTGDDDVAPHRGKLGGVCLHHVRRVIGAVEAFHRVAARTQVQRHEGQLFGSGNPVVRIHVGDDAGRVDGAYRPASFGGDKKLSPERTEHAQRRDVETFGVFTRARQERCRATAGDAVDLTADGGDEHVVAERADRVEQDASDGARQVAARDAIDAGDELRPREAGVIDMDDAVRRGYIDVPARESAQPERARDVVLGRRAAARNVDPLREDADAPAGQIGMVEDIPRAVGLDRPDEAIAHIAEADGSTAEDGMQVGHGPPLGRRGV